LGSPQLPARIAGEILGIMDILNKVDFRARFTLTFAAGSLLVLLLDHVLPLSGLLGLQSFNVFNPLFWVSLLTYPFVHASWDHLFGNMLLFLLLAPELEHRYGAYHFGLACAITSMATGLLNAAILHTGLVGASGIVFMCIAMTARGRDRGGKVSATFILVLLMYLAKELTSMFGPDNISQFAHIFGFVCGGILVYTYTTYLHWDKPTPKL
jgi:membrane associated rhomboid family serine protease